MRQQQEQEELQPQPQQQQQQQQQQWQQQQQQQQQQRRLWQQQWQQQQQQQQQPQPQPQPQQQQQQQQQQSHQPRQSQRLSTAATVRVNKTPPTAPRPPAADVEIVHGDCIDGMRQLAAGSVDLVIADPPYNIGVQGAPWDTVPDYLSWSSDWLRAAIAALRPGGSLFLYGSPVKLWICHLKILAVELGMTFKQHISWVYKQGGDSRLTGMTAYSVRVEHLEWLVGPGLLLTSNL